MIKHEAPGLTLRDFLVVEDDLALLDFRCTDTDLPLWPQIRVAMFRMMMSDLLYGVRLTGASNAAKSRTRAAKTMLRSLAHNAHQFQGERMCARICITAEGVADQWVDGQWFNRLSDHFVTARPADSIVLADHFEWRWPFPRQHRRMVMHAPWQATSAVLGKLRARPEHRRQANELVQLVTDRAKEHVGWILDPERREALTSMLVRKAASMSWQYDAYSRLMERIRPQLLMVGAGCYGPAASLIAAAKSLGIKTAEYQHGVVSGGHDAYNFAPAIRDSVVYQRTLPDHFLGYGTWWNEQFNAPVQKWAIGNPHRTARVLGFDSQEFIQKDLLILSDGIQINRYLNLARSLSAHAKTMGLRVVLRPHPLERTRALQMSEKDTSGFYIDSNADLYQSLKTTHTVVSEVSTGLFEAVGIVKRVLVWDTPRSRFAFPSHPFETFDSIDALQEKLMHDDDGIFEEAFDSEQIWAEGWKLNFNKFLSDQGLA